VRLENEGESWSSVSSVGASWLTSLSRYMAGWSKATAGQNSWNEQQIREAYYALNPDVPNNEELLNLSFCHAEDVRPVHYLTEFA
jgi:hypothetical protein